MTLDRSRRPPRIRPDYGTTCVSLTSNLRGVKRPEKEATVAVVPVHVELLDHGRPQTG
jgi:hypothetical protein